MKYSVIVACLLFPIFSATNIYTTYPKEIKVKEVKEPEIVEVIPEEPKLEDLINALIFIESSGRENAVGDTNLRTPSIGVLQIRQSLVNDVNRIQKRNKRTLRYTYDDRYSREKSIEMFMIWYNHYHTNSDFEKIARCWNGGPRGMKKDKTIQYWVKVQKELNFSPPELMVSDHIDDESI